MISYNRLWKTMEEKGITQYQLIRDFKFSANQIGRMKRNMFVSGYTINSLCKILECKVEDIMEYVPDIDD